MSKIRTLEQLESTLDEEFVWRKKELAQIKAVIRSSKASKPDFLIRGGISLLYAHWEGFVKGSGTHYLNYIASKRLTYNQVTSNIIALAMKSKLNAARDSNKATVYSQVSEFFLSGLDSRCEIPWEEAIETFSNLSSSVFREIVCIFRSRLSFL